MGGIFPLNLNMHCRPGSNGIGTWLAGHRRIKALWRQHYGAARTLGVIRRRKEASCCQRLLSRCSVAHDIHDYASKAQQDPPDLLSKPVPLVSTIHHVGNDR